MNKINKLVFSIVFLFLSYSLVYAQGGIVNKNFASSFNPSLRDIKILFNDNGIGLLYGFQMGGEIGTGFQTRTIYKFVIYRTTDGSNWTELKNPTLMRELSDTTGGLGPNAVHGYTHGSQLLLSTKSFETYVSKDGLNWEKYNYVGKDLDDFRNNANGNMWSSFFHVNSFSPYICVQEFGTINRVFKEVGGYWKEIKQETIDSSISSTTPKITVHIGRKTKYHAYDSYFFMNMQWPHYIADDNKEVYKLAQNNDLLQTWGGSTYSYPEDIYMPYYGASRIYAKFYKGYYVSNDGGRTFYSLQNKLPCTSGKFFRICNDGSIFIAGIEKKTDGNGKIYRSNDGGNTWLEIINTNESVASLNYDNWNLEILPNGKIIINSKGKGTFVLKEGCGGTITDPCANTEKKIDVHITGVPIIPQPNKQTCWAASASMMYNWHNKKSNISISNALSEIEKGYTGKFYILFQASNDLPWYAGGGISCLDGEDPKNLYLKLMGMNILPNSLSLIQLKNYLSEHGPLLMLRRKDCPNPKYQGCHAMILTGMQSNGTPECTNFNIIDPWAWDDSGKPITVREELWSFKKLFECQWDILAYPSKPQSNIISNNMNVKVEEENKYSRFISERLLFIENSLKTDQRINTEYGLASSHRKDGDWSAHWIFKPVPQTNYYWIENRWKPQQRLHVETGTLKSEQIGDEAWSAHWEIISVGNAYWIQNRWRQRHRIHVENGKLECSVIQDGAKSAMWYFKTVD